MSQFRVWHYEEFKDCDDVDQRDDLAWLVPNRYGILDPSHQIPIDDVREAAELFADYFHSQRDGWESTWPIEFVVHDGERYFVIEVERETVPEFHASFPAPLLGPPP